MFLSTQEHCTACMAIPWKCPGLQTVPEWIAVQWGGTSRCPAGGRHRYRNTGPGMPLGTSASTCRRHIQTLISTGYQVWVWKGVFQFDIMCVWWQTLFRYCSLDLKQCALLQNWNILPFLFVLLFVWWGLSQTGNMLSFVLTRPDCQLAIITLFTWIKIEMQLHVPFIKILDITFD